MPLKYLVQPTKANKTYTFQRAWPTALKDKAAQAGLPKLFRVPTLCAVDAPLSDQLEAQAWGQSQWDRQIALLKAETPTSMQVVSFRGKHKRKLYDRKALAKQLNRSVTLSSLYEDYLRQHPEKTAKAHNDRARYWSEWWSHLDGDAVADARALPSIHKAFDDWQHEMLTRGVAPSSVERARGSVRAILRWASRHHRIGWTIELQPLPRHTPKSKPVLSPAEQRRLLAMVVDDAGPTAAMVALMLAGGMMPTEIASLDVEATSRSLAARQPYVVVGAGGADVKAEARRRIVPIVWTEDVVAVIRKHLPAAIERSATTTDPSATVNSWLRQRSVPTTGHGLRHTLSASAQAAMVNPIALARIGGWSMAGVGISTQSLEYGRAVEDSTLVHTLAEECRKIWAHLPQSPTDSAQAQGLRLVT